MKYLILLAILMASSYNTDAQDWANLGRYAEQNKVVMGLDASHRKIVMMGNSITDLWADADTAFFVKYGIVGRGIGGQVSRQMRARFNDDVIALAPKAVVILSGTNDIAENDGKYNEDKTVDNIVAMVRMAVNNGIKPYISLVLPANEYPWHKDIANVAEKIASLNIRLKKFAVENSIEVIDYTDLLIAADGKALNPDYTGDGVHPNLQGYKVMEQFFVERLGLDKN